jgi:hypothetical protein
MEIYRFNFTKEFMDKLHNFSKIHQYDDRKSFKEAWTIWVEENDESVCEEIRRLINLGFNEHADIKDKMFKSARYYFRKKSTEKKEPRERSGYSYLQKKMLEMMDTHIVENVGTNPARLFIDFCENNTDIIKEEIVYLMNSGVQVDSETLKNKVKKTYKNRYFIYKMSITNKTENKTNDDDAN